MKSRNNKISVVLVVLSLIYVIYLTYISNNNLLVGATVSKGKNGDIVITNVDEFSMASYSGIEKGDIVKRINNKKINTNEIKMNKLKNVSSMIVERNGHNLELKMTLFNDKNFTTYLIPLIFYIVCLFCCFFILKINESKNLLSAVVLIIFLLSASIAFISAGGSAKGDMLSRLIMVVTLISVPLNYLLFLYQYFKELGTKLFNKKVFILYLIPVINVVCEIFRSHLFFRDYVPKLNLLAFFFLFIIVGVYFSIILIKNKDTEQAHIIKVLTIINIFSFSPFLCLYLIPYVFLNAHYVSSFLAASFMLLIPFSLVFQFMTNKIYNVDFILSRLRYYGFLALTPTIILISTIELISSPDSDFYSVKLTFLIYIIMLAVFYYKEVLDFRFRLKRVSEKFNYQDSIYKFTQMIRDSTSLSQVFEELKNTILEVSLVSRAHVYEVSADGNIKLYDDENVNSFEKVYQKEFRKVTSEIGKIVEFNKGFVMKIGERGGKSFVILCLSKMNTPRLTLEELSWLKTLAFYTNVSIENVMKIEELMSHLEEIKQQESNPVWLKKLMYTIEEKQRSDLARDLHDSVLQDLISLKRQCELFLGDFKKDDNPCREEVQDKLVQMNEQMSDVISMTRETCHELRPQLLYDLGLVKALSKLVAQQQERVPFHIRLNTGRFTASLDLDSQLNLYRIIQEFLSNAVKHSQATDVLIMLISIQNKIVLHYEDDGVGFDQEKNTEHSMSMGLSGIKERVRALDGRLRIETSEGKGFKADIEIEL
ncbi:histidine kinase [Bacillus subtilis]|uniref:histidine kinase n=2 Tax=Bacillus subtilis TaxID=1423 RepID=UPI002DBF224B|nr:histidine kinase [Bacillus subtilis]MEC3633490.1 histidine kinase [Bacillus subtilis]MEC3699085.1 histidine kinase [Bacillus subtilis]MEC3845266.1 histidine kinase [Bacillus subtilis]